MQDREFCGCLERLRKTYDLHFAIAHDARLQPHKPADWEADYAVLDLTVALSPRTATIPEELADGALTLLKLAQPKLARSRVFLVLRVLKSLNSPTWTLAMLFRESDGPAQIKLLRETASQLLDLRRHSKTFKDMYGREKHVLLAFTHTGRRVLGFATQPLLAFLQHTSAGTNLEFDLLADQCSRATSVMSAFFLGNASFFTGRYREAMEHYRWAVELDEAEAYLNTAFAHSKLGDMQAAFEWCKGAIQRGVSESQIKKDPDFAEFRAHPLFSEVKALLRARTAERRSARTMPEWTFPANLRELVDEADGQLEDDRYTPIQLILHSGTLFGDHEIPLTWQVEFDPSDARLEAARKKLEKAGYETDGDGWAEYIVDQFSVRHPELADQLHVDSESSTCVLWVESESSCRKLVELIWPLTR